MSSDAWRLDFRQSDRNKEVREIAKVLASLEPGASASSKLRLAMQFEDAVFHQAESLEDYRKRLSKRLRKVQKNYRPDKAPGETEREKKIEALRKKYGDAIVYCLQHGDKAVATMSKKMGEDKAKQLEKFLQLSKRWAEELGLKEGTTADKTMSNEHLDKLQQHMEKVVESMRAHVVKLVDQDHFIMENLSKAEEESRGRAAQLLAYNVQRRYAQVHKAKMEPLKLYQEHVRVATASMPILERNQANDEGMALMWIQKMRAASTASLAIVGMEDKTIVPPGTLQKLQSISLDGLKFVHEVMLKRKQEQKPAQVTLEDAWMKTIRIQSLDKGESSGGTTTAANTKEQSSAPNSRALVVRSKLLFTPGRKTPLNLLAVFRMKKATLVRPPPRGEGSHLILYFGKAFVMTIYFVPLVVRMTAYDENEAPVETSNSECAPWMPFSHGLTERKMLTVWGATGSYAELGQIVAERLRDASARATRILRRIFSKNIKENAPEFEQEILEGTALVEFLQLARTTYMPNWQDEI